MGSKGFDYYIFIDYSENLIGYTIIEQCRIKDLLPKISRFRHYREIRERKQYLKSIKQLFERDKILAYFDRTQVTELRKNIELCSEVLEFCKRNQDSTIFISVDDRQYVGFMKLLSLIDSKNIKVVKEGSLKRYSTEYRINCVIDTLLNIERNKRNFAG